MEREDKKNVASVIEANSKWVTLQQLAQRGKRQVRVISRNKVLELIQAVVDDAIERGAGKIAAEQRQQIVSEANKQFRHISAIEAKSEAVIGQQKELLTAQLARINQLEQAQVQLKKQIADQQAPLNQWEQTSRLQAASLCEAQQDLETARVRRKKSDRLLNRLTRRVTTQQATISDHERQIDKLVNQGRTDSELIAQLRSQLQDRQQELGRVNGLAATLNEEIARNRGESEPESAPSLRDELSQIKQFLVSLEKRNSQAFGGDIEALLKRINDKESAAKAQLETRFDTKLDNMLGKIGQALRVATARPIDRPVEATDVYISKLFDNESEMETNFQELDIQAITTKQSISHNLQRLKRLRSAPCEATEQPPSQQQDQGSRDH